MCTIADVSFALPQEALEAKSKALEHVRQRQSGSAIPQLSLAVNLTQRRQRQWAALRIQWRSKLSSQKVPSLARSTLMPHEFVELERLRLRQRQAYEQTNDIIDQLLDVLTKTKASLQAAQSSAMAIDQPPTEPPAAPAPALLLAPMMQQVQALQVAQKLSAEQKEMNAAIARVAKALDKAWPNALPEFLFEYPSMDPKLLAEV